MKVSELLTDASRWTQGAYGRDRNGDPVLLRSKAAVCWCLAGAVAFCYRDGVHWSDDVANDVELRIGKRLGGMTAWNDDPDRTFAEVRALILELDL